MFWLVVTLVIVWAITRYYLSGESLTVYDRPEGEVQNKGQPPSDQLDGVIERLQQNLGQGYQHIPWKNRLSWLRNQLDIAFDEVEIKEQITPVQVAGMSAEWVVAKGANPRKRLLYIHGGAFVMGSAKSHRALTAQLSADSLMAVLVINFRLMPEHSRMSGIEDCRNAYLWMLKNGPDGYANADTVFIAGDSSGGNMALSLSAWIRDQNRKNRALQTPDGVLAFSPSTDCTYSSPSLTTNIPTDPLLGPIIGKLLFLPNKINLWVTWATTFKSPSDPVISPVFGDLSGLPPTLVIAAQSEMLVDDGRRYVNKAVAYGSDARLLLWPNMVHVWPMFHHDLPEGKQALEQVKLFFNSLESNSSAPPNPVEKQVS